MIRRIKALARHWIVAFIHPRPLVGLFFLPRYFLHWIRYVGSPGAQKLRILDSQPCLGDWSPYTPFDAHYFYQGAWLARKVAPAKAARHVDVGSSTLTMSVLSAQKTTIFVDYRPLKATLPGLHSVAGNILNLPFADDSVESLSCLHVIEHIGLGRYGDPIDPQGSTKAALELQRVVRPGGSLYLTLPVGRDRVCFNAHRVHAPATVLAMFSRMKLAGFSFVDDAGEYHEAGSMEAAARLDYGCGMFHFEKP